jgi:hypothetical protein
MEPFIQIMIADADLRLLPVKAIARWPPDIRIHICALDNSFVIGRCRTGISGRSTHNHLSSVRAPRCKGGRPQPQLPSYVRVRTRAPTQTRKTLWQMARRLCRLIACIFGDFIRHRCWHFRRGLSTLSSPLAGDRRAGSPIPATESYRKQRTRELPREFPVTSFKLLTF